MRRLLLTISTWEWVLLLFILPLLAYPSDGRAWLLLAIPFFWLIRRLATDHFFPATPFNAILLLLGFALLLSLLAVIDIELSLPKIAGLILGVALFFAVVEHMQLKESGIFNVLGVVLVAGSTIAFLALFYAPLFGPLSLMNSAKSLLPSRYTILPGAVKGAINLNELAGIMAWIVPLFIAVTFGYGKRLRQSERLIYRLLFFGLVVGLILNISVLLGTFSRGGIFAVTVAVIIMFALRFRWGLWLLLAGLIIATLLAVLAGVGLLPIDLPGAANLSGISGRIEIWSRGIVALSDVPLTGFGMNGFRQIVHTMYPFYTILPTAEIAHAHNHLLQAGLDLGIFGLIAYLAIWFLSAVLLWQGLRSRLPQGEQWRALQIGLSGSLTAGWLFGIVDAIALGARPGFIWWLILALVVGATVLINGGAGPESEAGSAV